MNITDSHVPQEKSTINPGVPNAYFHCNALPHSFYKFWLSPTDLHTMALSGVDLNLAPGTSSSDKTIDPRSSIFRV